MSNERETNGYVQLPRRLSLKNLVIAGATLVSLVGHAMVTEYRFTVVREQRLVRIEESLRREISKSAKMYKSVCFMCIDLLDPDYGQINAECPVCEDFKLERR